MKMTFTQYEELKKKGLNDDQIQRAAQARGVELPSESLIGSVLKTTVLKPGARFGQAVGALGAKAFGVDDERLSQAIQKDQILQMPFGIGEVKIEGQKPFGEGGGTQIAADALESASYFAPYGRMAKAFSTPASKLFGNAAGKVLGGSASFATGGYATDVASGLRSGEENPYAPGMGTAIAGAIPFVPPVFRQAGRLAKFGTTQATGLAPETVSTLLTNPKALTVAQAENLDRGSLAQQVRRAFTSRRDALSGLGKEYEPIRQSGKVVKLTEDIPETVLNKYGVKIENGTIKVGPESAPLSSTDRKAIEDFIAQYGGAKELTANGILNVRKALDNMVGWEQGKTGIVKTIEKEMRKMYDGIAKKQIPKLAELDVKYAPEARMIRGWQKDFFNPDGSLKDAAINKIANIAGKGKDQQLARLEKLIPGIGQKAQILKALEDIGAAEGHKVGTYFRGGNLLAGVGGFAAGGPVGAVISALVASPQISVPILKTVGRIRGWGDDAVTRLVAKITTGKTLNNAELVMFRSAVGEHLERLSPGDQFLDSALKKKVTAAADDVVPPVQTKIPVQAVTEAGEDVVPNVVQDVVPPQPVKASTPLPTATRQGVQKSSSLPNNTTRPVSVAKEELGKIEQEISFRESQMNEFPFDAARSLMKFYRKGDKSLEEMNYQNLGTERKSARLDDIVNELGFNDLNEAESAIEKYIVARDELADTKKYYQKVRREVRNGEDVLSYDTPAYYSKELDIYEVFSETDPKLLRRLTRERGAIGKPSNEFLLNSAKRELAKTPNDPKLKAFVSEMELMQEARKYKTAEEFVKGQELGIKQAQTGKPITAKLYHGSPDARFAEEFDPKKPGYYKDAPDLLPDMKEWESLNGKPSQGFRGESVTGNMGVSFTDDVTTAKSYASKPAFDNQNSVPMVLERYVTLQNPKVYELGGKKWDLNMEQEMRKALDQGYDGLVFKNIVDDYHPFTRSKPTNNIIALNPSQIKTRSQLLDIYNRTHATPTPQKSTTQKIKDFLLPPGIDRERGFVYNPFNKTKINAIDKATKDELLTVQQYLEWSLKTGKTNSKYEDLLEKFSDKYGIDMNQSTQKQIKRIEDLLEKTDTMEALPGTKK